ADIGNAFAGVFAQAAGAVFDGLGGVAEGFGHGLQSIRRHRFSQAVGGEISEAGADEQRGNGMFLHRFGRFGTGITEAVHAARHEATAVAVASGFSTAAAGAAGALRLMLLSPAAAAAAGGFGALRCAASRACAAGSGSF